MSCHKNNSSVPLERDDIYYDEKTKVVHLTDLYFFKKNHDFSTVSSDTVLKARYDFVNSGDDTLFITSVIPDCICTGFFLSNDVIAPKDSAYIFLELETKGKSGEVILHTTMEANTETRFYILRMKAKILEE